MTKKKTEAYHKELSIILDYWNSIYQTQYKATRALLPNYIYWRQDYTFNEIGEAVRLSKASKFWKDKITPVIFLRQKTPQGELTDRIAEFLNLRPRSTITQEGYASSDDIMDIWKA